MKHADIEWREDGQPLSRAFDDIYFSTHSGLEESRYVFLQQNRLPERFAALRENATFTIGETGFGTGLNFLAAWQLWRSTAPASARLHFISVEKYPLSRGDLQRAFNLWPELEALVQPLLAAYPPLLADGVHRLQFDGVDLTLVIGEASDTLHSLRLESPRDRVVDAWFLDGFAPSKNPEMWSEDLFRNIAALSRPGASFATFTCAGLVKRGLKGAGFVLEKVPGYAHKREMLRGRLEHAATPAPEATPWHLPARELSLKAGQTAAVIGAGIAGAAAARALAERGLQVAVFERGPQPASGASGNEQGILYAKLSPKPGPNGDFNLHALQFALRYYRRFCPRAFHACGLLQLTQSEKDRRLQQQLADWLAQQPEQTLVRTVDAREASAIAGLPLSHDGLHFPAAGWLEPAAVCAELLRHHNIQLRCNTEIRALRQEGDGHWQLHTPTQSFRAEAVILCSASGMAQFPQAAPLPLRPIRGQVSGAPATPGSRKLAAVVCGEGYIAPAFHGRHSYGATFKLKETGTDVREEEQRENLATLEALTPEIAREFSALPASGRAAVRAATPDYLPIAGPVPDWASLREIYARLGKDRKLLIKEKAEYQSGLFALGGLGSRGFTYAPLAAELVAAWVCGEAPPVNSALTKALHPARFAIRGLIKGRE